MNLAKPPKRGPKPRKAIKRGSMPARVRKTASGRAKHAADIAWAKAVRESGPCAAKGVSVGWTEYQERDLCVYVHTRCNEITAAHVVSRRYSATRTDRANGLPLCLNAHRFFTEHPLAWEAFVIKTIGQERFAALKAKAQAGPKGNS